MSVATPSVPDMLDRRRIRDHRGHHPWHTIGMLPDWTVEFVDHLPADEPGLTIHAEKRVLILDSLDEHERRSTMCHETGHVLRGPVASALGVYEEALVDRQAARLLMPSVKRIGHTLAWHAADYERTAFDLWVDEGLLNTRLSTLAPADREWLDEQLDTILI